GLQRIVDLGEWWEGETGHPIPLGGIAVRRDVGPVTTRDVDSAIVDSLRHARSRPEDVWPTVRRHAQEMDDGVMRRHIDLYVNRHSEDYGPDGEAAIHDLFERAEG